MNKQTYLEVMATLAASGLIASEYRYYKDRYSLALLQASLPDDGSAVAVAALKRSRCGYLLDKPKVASLVRRLRGQPLARHHVRAADCAREEVSYRLGFSSWGATDYWAGQTSRQGINLVVQLNFDRAHDIAFERLVKPTRGERPFCRGSHPHSRSRNTMAWARVDLDFEHSEALIEEVQTDWLREVRWAADRADWALTPDPRGKARHFDVCGVNGSAQQVARYHANHVVPHLAIWSEAMLSAAVQVVARTLRIRRVYFHSLESGRSLRSDRRWSPPRSLYTDLPRQFGFDETDEPPAFLGREEHVRALRKSDQLPRLFVLQL